MLVGEAKGASANPSLLVVVVKLSELLIVPLLVIEPTAPPRPWMATELFTPLRVTEPSTLTLFGTASVPLFSVMAGVEPVTDSDPLADTSMLAPPVPAVAVATGAFAALLMVSVVWAAPRPATRQRGASATAATRVLRIQESPLGGLRHRHKAAVALLQALVHRVQSPRAGSAIRRGAPASSCVKVMLQSIARPVRQASATLVGFIPSRCRSA